MYQRCMCFVKCCNNICFESLKQQCTKCLSALFSAANSDIIFCLQSAQNEIRWPFVLLSKHQKLLCGVVSEQPLEERKKERKKKYFIKFIESWSQKFKFIQKSRKGENYSDCTWTRTQNRLVFKQTLETFGQFGQMVECSFMN